MHCIRTAALALAITVLLGGALTRAQEQPGAMVVVFDGSGSMWGRLPGSTQARFELAVEALRTALPALPASLSSGVVGFGAGSKGCAQITHLAQPGLHETDRIVAALEGWNPRGRGPLAAALQFAAEPFAERKVKASLVVVHDGNDNCGADPCAVARRLKDANPELQINLVGLAVPPNELKAMRCVADLTGGRMFEAASSKDVDTAVSGAVRAAMLHLGTEAPGKSVSAETPKPAPRSPHLGGLDGPGLRAAVLLEKDGAPTTAPILWRLSRHPDGAASASASVAAIERAPHFSMPLPAGRYTLEAEHHGFKSQQTFELKPGAGHQVTFLWEAGLLDVAATIAGALPLSDKGEIRILGQDRQLPRDGLMAGPEGGTFILPPGTYRVRASDGSIGGETTITVIQGRHSKAAIELQGGRLDLIVREPTRTAAVLPDLKVVLQEDNPGKGERREVGRTTTSRSQWTLPAGTYYAQVVSGTSAMTQQILVPPGVITTAQVAVESQSVRLTVANAEAIAANSEAYRWRITALDRGEAETIGASGADVEIALAPGRYRIVSHVGHQNGSNVREVAVASGRPAHVLVNHDTGTVLLRASGLGPATTIFWEVEDGSGQALWSSAKRSPNIYLNPGEYSIAAWVGGRVLRQRIRVGPQTRQTVTVGVP